MSQVTSSLYHVDIFLSGKKNANLKVLSRDVTHHVIKSQRYSIITRFPSSDVLRWKLQSSTAVN